MGDGVISFKLDGCMISVCDSFISNAYHTRTIFLLNSSRRLQVQLHLLKNKPKTKHTHKRWTKTMNVICIFLKMSSFQLPIYSMSYSPFKFKLKTKRHNEKRNTIKATTIHKCMKKKNIFCCKQNLTDQRNC